MAPAAALGFGAVEVFSLAAALVLAGALGPGGTWRLAAVGLRLPGVWVGLACLWARLATGVRARLVGVGAAHFLIAAGAFEGLWGADGGDALGDGDFEFFGGLGVVVEAGKGDAGEAFVDGAFDGAEVAFFFLGDKREGVAGEGGAAGAADAVDVVFGEVGAVKINDVGDGFDIDAAGGDVGGDEDAVVAVFETGEGGGALALGAVAVDGGAGDAVFLEVVGEAVGAVLGAGEADDGLKFLIFEHFDEQGGLEMLRDGVDGLGDADGGGGLAFLLDQDGVFEKLLREFADRLAAWWRRRRGFGVFRWGEGI